MQLRRHSATAVHRMLSIVTPLRYYHQKLLNILIFDYTKFKNGVWVGAGASVAINGVPHHSFEVDSQAPAQNTLPKLEQPRLERPQLHRLAGGNQCRPSWALES